MATAPASKELDPPTRSRATRLPSPALMLAQEAATSILRVASSVSLPDAMTLTSAPPTRRRRLSVLMTCTALTLAACSDGGTGPDSRVVAGVDFDVLFAEPTTQEIAAVSDEWATRGHAATDVSILVDSTVAIGSLDVRVRIVSHDVGGITHYGAVLNDGALAGPAPVLVYAHGGDEGVAVDGLLGLFPFLGDLAGGFVWVVPSFRSEDLSWGDETWTSDGPASPWDRDVDDALSLLDVALDVESAADEGSVGVLGFSRGGGVALLMGIRDARIDRIVEFFGPTDFFGPYVQDIVEEALIGSLRDLPGLVDLDQDYLQPMKNGALSIAQVRTELIRRSAVFYADRLPALQVHHGEADTTVEVSQAEALIAVMEDLGRGEPDFQAYLYPGGGHDPLSLPGSVDRAVSFLTPLLPAPGS
ncbi:MAG: peptidase [Gemmatimonadota bacterium]